MVHGIDIDWYVIVPLLDRLSHCWRRQELEVIIVLIILCTWHVSLWFRPFARIKAKKREMSCKLENWDFSTAGDKGSLLPYLVFFVLGCVPFNQSKSGFCD